MFGQGAGRVAAALGVLAIGLAGCATAQPSSVRSATEVPKTPALIPGDPCQQDQLAVAYQPGARGKMQTQGTLSITPASDTDCAIDTQTIVAFLEQGGSTVGAGASGADMMEGPQPLLIEAGHVYRAHLEVNKPFSGVRCTLTPMDGVYIGIDNLSYVVPIAGLTGCTAQDDVGLAVVDEPSEY